MKYDSIACEFYLNGVWVDLNAYRLQAAGITGSMGIRSSNPIDRVASTGQLTLVLHNVNNLFTPGHANCMSGFQSGMRFRLRLTYEGRTRTRFYGIVPPDGIEIGTTQFMTVTRINVLDFMEQMAIHQLDLPTYTTDKRLEQVIALILANMPIKPLSTSYGTGRSTFASVFDTLRDKTRAMQEVSKATLSELGYVYLKQTTDSDEVLTVENRGFRSGKALATVNVRTVVEPDMRVTEAGDTRITEAGDVRSTQAEFTTVDAVFNNNYRGVEVKHAESYYNQVDTKAYPRKVDTSDVILFSLERPLEIGAYQTVTMKGRFRDPNQEAQTVAALSTVSPVSGTDYIFNAAKDESGANITADLSVTAVYGANGVDYTLENTGAITGYVTQLYARGKGVYIYRPVEKMEEDEMLVANDGARTLNMDLPYQDDPLQTADIATALLAKYKQKYTTIQSLTLIANRNDTYSNPAGNYQDFLLNAFMDLQVGDKVKVKASSVGIEQDCFIQSIDFTITSGDIVTYTYGLQDSMYETYDAWILEDATYGVLGTTTILGY
ncbi:MAG: hypothetical protein PHT43_04730 [Anaerolineaceae bacterium]|nr:hypothetical protein [Anaerolineaceae bacterium]